MRQRPLVTRTTALMLVALAGMTLAAQPGLIAGRLGWSTYLVVVGLAVLALAAMVRPRR